MIQVGEKVPSVKVKIASESGGGEEVATEALFANKRVVVFGVPGAFTPTCSAKHLPGFLERAAEITAKGVDLIACVAVNDAFVMGAWGRDQKAFGKVTMIADGNGDLARALGVEHDFSGATMGRRNKRFAAILEGGVVKHFAVEEPGKFEVSSAEAVLAKL